MEDLKAARAASAWPRDLAAFLAARPDARLLEGGAQALAALVPRFTAATAIVPGGAASVIERGTYARSRWAGEFLASTPGRISLRFAPGGEARLAHTPADPERGLPEALCLFDPAGRIAHRVEIDAAADLALLAGLLSETPASAEPRPEVRGETADLPAIRRALAGWADFGITEHLDTLLPDGGRARRVCLPRLERAARRIDLAGIAPLLGQLARRGRPFRRVFARRGCLRIQEGPIDPPRAEGSRLFLRSGNGLIALDLAALASAWVTWIGRGREASPALEFYDTEGCAAVFLASTEPDPCRDTVWQCTLHALPDARPSTTAAFRHGLIRRLKPCSGPRLVGGRESASQAPPSSG